VSAGGEAVLGAASFQSSHRAAAVEVSPEMAVDRQKSQEGSGVLCVKVMTDGPTRVLQITDVTQQVSSAFKGPHAVNCCCLMFDFIFVIICCRNVLYCEIQASYLYELVNRAITHPKQIRSFQRKPKQPVA